MCQWFSAAIHRMPLGQCVGMVKVVLLCLVYFIIGPYGKMIFTLNIMGSEIRQETERQMSRDLTYMWSVKNILIHKNLKVSGIYPRLNCGEMGRYGSNGIDF